MADYLIVGLGVFLVLLVLLDAFLLVLHVDSEGMVAPQLFRGIWIPIMVLTRWIPSARRSLLALAGPLMMVGIFVSWLAVFILGFSLIVWPSLNEAYRTETELGALSFIDAVYYTGVTVTVLGYGDITPLSGGLKIMVFVMSGLGFALLTGVVTYLLNVIGGTAERNALALQVRAIAGGTTAGLDVVEKYLNTGDAAALQQRLLALLQSLQTVQEKMHQFPILDVYYRSRMASRDPEAILRTLVEITIASSVATQAESARTLGPLVLELKETLNRLMLVVGSQHFSRKTNNRLAEAKPGATEEQLASRALDRLRPCLRGAIEEAPSQELLSFISRARLFLEELDRFSDWKRDHPADEVLRL